MKCGKQAQTPVQREGAKNEAIVEEMTRQPACGRSHPTLSQRMGAGRGCPLGVPPEGAQGFPLPAPPFLTKAHRFGPRWLLRPVQSFRVPSRWWVNQNSQELHFLY